MDNKFVQAICSRGCGGSVFTQADLIHPPEPDPIPEPEPEKQSSSTSYATVSGPFMCPKISDHTVQATQNHVPSFEYFNCHYNNGEYGYPEGRIEISYLIDSVGVPGGWCTGKLTDESNINAYGGYTAAHLTSNSHQIFINISFGADDHDESIAAAKQMLYQMEKNNSADSCSSSGTTSTKSEPKDEPKSTTDDTKNTTCPAGYRYLDMYGGVCAKIPTSDDTSKSDSDEISRTEQAEKDKERIEQFNKMMKEKEEKNKIAQLNTYISRGNLSFDAGNYEQAILFFNKANEIIPSNEITAKIKEAKDLLEEKSDDLDYSELLDEGNGSCHGDYDVEKARTYFQKAIDLQPNNYLGYADMSRCLYLGDRDASAEYLYKTLELNPNHKETVIKLLEMNLPIPAGSKEIAKNIQVEQFIERGENAIGDSRYDAAISLLNQAKKIAPNAEIDSLIDLANFKKDTLAHFQKCKTLDNNENYGQAANCFQELHKKAPEDTSVFRELAYAHLHNDDYDGLMSTIKKWRTADPNDPEISIVLGLNNLKSGADKIIPKIEKVPGWVKNNAKWWAEGQLKDEDFLNGIEHLVKEKIINIPDVESKKELETPTERTLNPSAASTVYAAQVLESSNYEMDVPQFWETKATDKSQLPQRTYYSEWDYSWMRTLKLGVANDIGQKINLQSSDDVRKYIQDYEKQRCADSQLNPVFMEDNGGFDGYSTCLEYGSFTFKETTVNGLDAYQISYEWKQKWRESDGYTEYPSWVHWENLIPYGDDLILVSGESVSQDRHKQQPIILDSINSFKILNDSQQIFDSDTSNEEKIPDWIKTNAEWWANGQISEDDFVNGIKYLVESGIVRVN